MLKEQSLQYHPSEEAFLSEVVDARTFGFLSDVQTLQANGLAKTADGGYVLCGLTNSSNGDVSGFHSGGFFDPDIWVCKTDASGFVQWQRCCGGSGQDESFNIYEQSIGNYVVTGFTYSSNYDVTLNRGSADGWLLIVAGSAGMETYRESDLLSLYPNPAATSVAIKAQGKTRIEISDTRLAVWGRYSTGGGQTTIDISSLPAGIYFVKATSEKGSATIKLIKL